MNFRIQLLDGLIFADIHGPERINTDDLLEL